MSVKQSDRSEVVAKALSVLAELNDSGLSVQEKMNRVNRELEKARDHVEYRRNQLDTVRPVAR